MHTKKESIYLRVHLSRKGDSDEYFVLSSFAQCRSSNCTPLNCMRHHRLSNEVRLLFMPPPPPTSPRPLCCGAYITWREKSTVHWVYQLNAGPSSEKEADENSSMPNVTSCSSCDAKEGLWNVNRRSDSTGDGRNESITVELRLWLHVKYFLSLSILQHM